MTDQDNLRDRIAAVMFAADVESGAIHIDLWTDLKGEYQNAAQAIIDEFGLTVHGDGCGYHEIHGSYDTRFEEKR